MKLTTYLILTVFLTIAISTKSESFFCSSKRISDLVTTLNTSANNCFSTSNNTYFTRDCYSVDNMILCNPSVRHGVRKEIVDFLIFPKSNESIRVKGKYNISEVYKMHTMEEEIYYNGNWISNLSYHKINVTFARLNPTTEIFNDVMVNAYSHPYYKNFNTNIKYKRDLQTVFVTWEQPIITVILGGNELHDVWIMKPGVSMLNSCNGTCKFTVPETFFTDSTKLEVDIYLNSDKSLIYSEDFSVAAQKYCPIPVNPYSSTWSFTYNCLDNPVQKFFIVCMFFGLSIIKLIILIVIGCILYVAYLVIKNKLGFVETNGLTNIISNNTNSNNSVLDDGEIEMQSSNGVPEWARRYLEQKRNGGLSDKQLISSLLYIGVAVLLLSPVAGITMCGANTTSPDLKISACQYTFSLKSQDIVCSNNGSFSSCEVDFNTQITFKTIGQTYCLNLIDDNNETMYIIQLTWEKEISMISLDFQYWTTPWVPKFKSNTNCKLTNGCVFSGCPDNPSSPNIVNGLRNSTNANFYTSATNGLGPGVFPSCYTLQPISNISNFGVCLTNYPSANQPFSTYDVMPLHTPNLQCNNVDGGWLNGCAVPLSQSCQWTWYDQELIPEIYSVYLPSTKYRYPILRGMVYNPNKDCYNSLINISFQNGFVSNPSVPLNIPIINTAATSSGIYSPLNLNFILISQNRVNDYNFADNKFILSPNGSYMSYGQASPANGPIPGLVGDVQCKSFQDAQTNTKVWSVNSVNIIRSGTTPTFVFPPMGIRLVRYGPTPNTYSGIYPSTINGSIKLGGIDYTRINGAMVGYDLSPQTMTIGLSTTTPFKVTFTNNVVCPTFSYVSSSGCSSCLRGVNVIIVGKSNCMAGMVDLLMRGPGSLSTNSIFLDKTESYISITIFADEESSTFEITASEGGSTASITFSGFFPKEVQLTDGSYAVYQNETKTYNTNDIASWWDSLSFELKIGIPISIIVGFIAIIGLAIGLIVLSIYCNRAYKPSYSQLF